MGHVESFFNQASEITRLIDHQAIEKLAVALAELRERGGRLFLLGVGGGAGHCSHAVNDFRKLCGIEAYAPTDNVSELTARTNDEGWETVFAAWLRTSKANDKDAIFVFSVGGGDAERNVSANLVHALDEGKRRGVKIFGVVGRNGGATAEPLRAGAIAETSAMIRSVLAVVAQTPMSGAARTWLANGFGTEFGYEHWSAVAERSHADHHATFYPAV